MPGRSAPGQVRHLCSCYVLQRALHLPSWQSELEPPPHKGRGATFNPKVRFESRELDPFDDGWGSLAQAPSEAPPPRDRGVRRHQPQRDRAQPVARHPVRQLDQPLSRLRAWLHLLLRAAEPRLSRPVARARFRDQAVRQARRGGAAGARAGGARLSLRADRARPQHRSLPAAGAPPADHAQRPRGAGAAAGTRSRSSPSRRRSCAISTCWRRWRRTASRRSSSRSPRSIRSWRASSSRAPQHRIAACRRSRS